MNCRMSPQIRHLWLDGLSDGGKHETWKTFARKKYRNSTPRVPHGFSPMPIPRALGVRLGVRVRMATTPSRIIPHALDLSTGTGASSADDVLRNDDRGFTGIVRQMMSQLSSYWWYQTGKEVEEIESEELEDELIQKGKIDGSKNIDGSIKVPPNIWRFLKPVPTVEVKMARVMASFSNLAYCMRAITPKSLFRRYGVELVTTSLTCKQPENESERIDEAIMSGDGMAVSPRSLQMLDENMQLMSSDDKASNIVVAQELQELDPLEKKENTAGWDGTRKAAAVMASSVGLAAGSLYSQAMAQIGRQVTQAAIVGQSAVNVTVARVLRLLQAALNPADAPSDSSGAVPGSSNAATCPTEWFVCDHKESNVRLFCIQGSDNFESWQTNLSFDPVVFEDESLGVRVHRGVYEAAKSLYDLYVPLVRDHVNSSDKAKISLTGHSLGGSLATMLLLMFVHRGVLPIESVGTVYTFGGAATFCEAAVCGGNCANCALNANCDPHEHGIPTLLKRLGIREDAVLNVMMHKDIVPRAFACDYSPVANFLSQVPSFRDHGCLQNPRSLLYGFIGKMVVLQPSNEKTYVKGEGGHPMLPEGAGLFYITDPDVVSEARAIHLKNSAKEGGKKVGEDVRTWREAVLSFMDNPHPLETLADAGAYGENGSISRYHNPLHYFIGLGSVLEAHKSDSFIQSLWYAAEDQIDRLGNNLSSRRKRLIPSRRFGRLPNAMRANSCPRDDKMFTTLYRNRRGVRSGK